MGRILFSILLSFFSLFFVHSVQAASCTISPGTANFGSINSFIIQSTSQIISGTTGFKCTGGNISILGTNYVNATISSTNNQNGTVPRLKHSTSTNYIPYNLCQEASCTTNYQVGSIIQWNSTTLLGLLGLFSGADGSLPIYLKTAIGSNIPAGTYTDIINIQWDWKLCDLGLLGACLFSEGSGSSTINISLDVSNICAIESPPNVNFGSAALPSSFNAINSNVLQTRCTKDANYSIKLTSTQGEIDGMRQMLATVNGSNYYLQYQLYRSGVAWTSTNDLGMTGLGTIQDIPYQAKINADQQNIPAGSYSDTVTVTITY